MLKSILQCPNLSKRILQVAAPVSGVSLRHYQIVTYSVTSLESDYTVFYFQHTMGGARGIVVG
jgi:hypothetical protein